MMTNSKLCELIFNNTNEQYTRIRNEITRIIEDAEIICSVNRSLCNNAEKLQNEIKSKIKKIEDQSEKTIKEVKESVNTIQINSRKISENTIKALCDANLQQKEIIVNSLEKILVKKN